MAGITIPLITEFKDVGIKQAIKEFKNLETAGEKAHFAIKKAAVPALAVIGGFAAVAQSAVKEFAIFETSINEVFTLLPGLSAKAKDEIIQDVKDFSKEFGVLPEKTIPALYQAISAGIPKENVFTFLEIAQKAAMGGVTDLTTAVDGITSVVNAYGSEVLNATAASDLMFTAVKLGKTDFEQLSSSLFQVAPIAASLGVGFDVVTAALADLTAKGTPTSVAASQMKAALSELGKEGTKADVAFRDIANIGFQEFIKGGGSVKDAFVLLSEGAADSGLSVLDLFGSIEAGQAILSLTSDGGIKFSETLDQMAKSSGATETAFNTMNTGTQVAFDKMAANLQIMKINLGEKLAPVVGSFVKFLSDNMDTFIILGATIGIIAAAVLVVNAGFMVYAAYVKVAAAAQWLFNAAMNANPITLAVIAIGLLGVAVVVAYKKFEGFRNVVKAVFDGIKAAINFGKKAWEGYVAYVEYVLAIALKVFQFFRNDVWGVIKQIVTGVKSIMGGVVDALIAPFKAAFNGIARAWNNTIGKFSFTVPSWVPSIGGKGFSMPDIPYLADGGIVNQPTLAMIGEKGPEAVIPLTGRNAGAGGTTYVTINTGADPQAVVRALQTYNRTIGAVPLNTRAF